MTKIKFLQAINKTFEKGMEMSRYKYEITETDYDFKIKSEVKEGGGVNCSTLDDKKSWKEELSSLYINLISLV